MRRALLACACAVALASVFGVRARAQDSAPITTLFRVLAYDSTLTARSGGVVVIAVVHRPGAASSCMLPVQYAVGEATFSGMPVRLVAVPYVGAGAFESSVVAAGTAVIFVCTDLDDAVGAISGVSRRHSMLTLSLREGYVRAGLSVGIVVRDEGRRLLVNLPAVRAEGAHLAPALLRVAEVLQ